MRQSLVLALAAALSLSLGGELRAAIVDFESPALAVLQTNPVRHEPILVYESVGGFIAGGHHDLLVVYNDGSAVYSRLANQGTFCEAGVPKTRVDKLHNDLIQANALLVRDQPLSVADAPLQTVTFLDYPPTAPRGIANTFSFDLPTGPSRTQVEAILQAFLKEVFPGC